MLFYERHPCFRYRRQRFRATGRRQNRSDSSLMAVLPNGSHQRPHAGAVSTRALGR